MLAVAGTTESGESGLHFAVLGPLQVTRKGERLALGGPQQRAVLALLLAEAGAVVSVGRLADALWGEDTPSGFVTTVQTYVFHLREVLEPGRGHGQTWRVLVTEPGSGYRLDTRGSSVDSVLFEGSVRAGRDAMGRGAYDEALIARSVPGDNCRPLA
jgi:DNA-binding SARP family transcriptional activator